MTNNTILIVDDERINREILASLFEDQYEVLQASGGSEAMQLISQRRRDLAVVLLDVFMPDRDGFAVLDFLKFNHYKQDLPVILITASSDWDVEARGLREGADDFISKPFDPAIVRQRVTNAIELYRYKRGLEDMIRRQAAKFNEISQFVTDVLMTVMQVRNRNSRSETLRISSYTEAVLRFISEFSPESYSLDSETIDQIVMGSLLHDIGVIAVPQEYFERQSLLTPEEQRIVESHTDRGCEIIASLENIENSDYIRTALDICRYHHERWDGSGYPEHLVGDDIPLAAQVVGLADLYDGLRQGKVTGHRYSHEEALEAIETAEFGAFSPILTESCKLMGYQFRDIYDGTAEAKPA
ncbi:MAG: response regulator [Clostridia bacterium]|nr:response regulator [Clostridia bacterium]